jgi:uncharacterized protein
MQKTTLALCCLLLTGACFAQQTPAGNSSPAAAPAPSKAPAVASPSQAANPPASTAPANPLSDAQAKQLLELTGAMAMKDQISQGMLLRIHSSMPFMPQDVTEDMDQSLAKIDYDTPLIAVYKQHVSADDADALIAFCKTPAGKSMIQVLPIIMQQTQQAVMQAARKAAQDVIQNHRPELEAAVKKYQEEHGPKPANTPGAVPAASPGAAPAAAPAATPAATNATPAAKPAGAPSAGSPAQPQ